MTIFVHDKVHVFITLDFLKKKKNTFFDKKPKIINSLKVVYFNTLNIVEEKETILNRNISKILFGVEFPWL